MGDDLWSFDTVTGAYIICLPRVEKLYSCIAAVANVRADETNDSITDLPGCGPDGLDTVVFRLCIGPKIGPKSDAFAGRRHSRKRDGRHNAGVVGL